MAFLAPILFGSAAATTAATVAAEAVTTGTAGLFGFGGVAGAGGYLSPVVAGITGADVIKGGLAVATMGSGYTEAAGHRQAGEAAYQSGMYNAAVSQQQAQREREASEQEAKEFTKKQRRLLSSASVGRTGGSGVTMSGSPLLVDEDTINEIAFNEAMIRSGGEARATRQEQQAVLQRSGAEHARTASYYRAGGSILGTARDLIPIFTV